MEPSDAPVSVTGPGFCAGAASPPAPAGSGTALPRAEKRSGSGPAFSQTLAVTRPRRRSTLLIAGDGVGLEVDPSDSGGAFLHAGRAMRIRRVAAVVDQDRRHLIDLRTDLAAEQRHHPPGEVLSRRLQDSVGIRRQLQLERHWRGVSVSARQR